MACIFLASPVFGADGPGRTSLSNPQVQYKVPGKHYVVLKRGEVEAVITDNTPVDDEILPNHGDGFNGMASLKHVNRQENLFVPRFAGLNLEHIHDGTNQERSILFEPRNAPMQLRKINGHTAEVYQPPTPFWQLESCMLYELLHDGTIEMTFECIPHKQTFKNGYIGLFWASYINKPESLDIHFLGRRTDDPSAKPGWIQGVTPQHGTKATHLAIDDNRDIKHTPDFSLRLAFNLSDYRYSEPWYYGVSHGMAFVQMFRKRDGIRFSQSPSGGGKDCPAWDFQYFIPNYEVGKRYGFVMMAIYLPYESQEQVVKATERHRAALNPSL